MPASHTTESAIQHRSGCKIHRYYRLILAFSSLLILANSLTGQDKLIDEQVISKWKAYEVFSRRLQGTARVTKTFDSGKEERLQDVFKQNNKCVLCVSDYKAAGQQVIYRYLIANPRYAVRLKRSKTDPDQVVLDKFSNDPNGIFEGFAQSLFAYTFAQTSPHFVVGRPLYEFFADPKHEIQKMSKEISNGHEFVRIDYRYKSDPNRKNTRILSNGQGWFILDPSRCWCVVRWKLSARIFSNKGEPIVDREHDIQFEFSDHSSGFPLVKSKTSHVVHRLLKKNDNENHREVIEYEWEGQRSCTGFGVHPIRIRPSRTRKRYGAETNSALSLDSSRRCCLRVAGSWFSVSSSTTKPRCRHNLRVTTIVYSKSSYLCAWAACGLFLCAGFYFAVHDSVNPAEQALIFEEEQTLEPRPIGMYSVEIHVRNRSHKLCWILGMEGR